MDVFSPVIIGENDQKDDVERADNLREPENGVVERKRVEEKLLPIIKVS